MAEHVRLAKTRRYTLRRRATAMDRTRDRITKAAVELHGSVGPAATTMSAVAERAGVTRATLYRHFQDEATLFAACSAEWLAAHPRPDPAALAAGDREARLAEALDAVYAWYRADAPMRANLLRDADVFPAAIRAGIRSFPDTFVNALAREWGTARGAEARGRRSRAALALAFSFETWRRLTERGLSDAEARDLMLRLVRVA
jgi:AcrR family transcriptional regulator